jgi:hypothetical protein
MHRHLVVPSPSLRRRPASHDTGTRAHTGARPGRAITRIVHLVAEDTLQVTVGGRTGAYVTARVLAVPDPTYTVYGPKTFERQTGKPYVETVHFTIPATAAPPFRKYVTNGMPDGTHRTSSAVVRLGGVEILGPSDLSQQVAALVRQCAKISSASTDHASSGPAYSRCT